MVTCVAFVVEKVFLVVFGVAKDVFQNDEG